MAEVEEAKKKITITWGLLAFIIAAVFVITSVYWRFVVLEHDFRALEERIEYVNERIDKKTDRVQEKHSEDIKEIDARLKILEKPGTDSGN